VAEADCMAGDPLRSGPVGSPRGPQAHDQRLQVQGRDGGRLAMGADGTELMVLIGVGRSSVDRIQPRRLLLAVDAAILTFVVDVTTSGFNLNTVGVILMVAGALGLVLSLLFWSSFSPYRRSRTVAGPDTVVEERRIERDLP
jgi:hypothetical protein